MRRIGDKGRSAPVSPHHGKDVNGSACSVLGLGSNLHLDQDAAIIERSLADSVTPFPCFDSCLLDRVHLNESVEMTLLAPAATEVVVLDRPSRRVDDCWILPIGELDEKPRRHAAEKLCRAMHGFDKGQSTTGRSNSGLIVDLRLNLYDVRHWGMYPLLVM